MMESVVVKLCEKLMDPSWLYRSGDPAEEAAELEAGELGGIEGGAGFNGRDNIGHLPLGGVVGLVVEEAKICGGNHGSCSLINRVGWNELRIVLIRTFNVLRSRF